MPAKSDIKKELEALETVLESLDPLEPTSRTFVLRTAIERLGLRSDALLGDGKAVIPSVGGSGKVHANGGGATPASAKQFLKDKKPTTEVQRVAVLAYYLTNYGDTLEFKAPDLVRLNQDSGGVKIGNPQRAVDNATRRHGYLVSVGGGKKKISAHGEEIVDALPSQELVAALEKTFTGRKRSKRQSVRKKRASK